MSPRSQCKSALHGWVLSDLEVLPTMAASWPSPLERSEKTTGKQRNPEDEQNSLLSWHVLITFSVHLISTSLFVLLAYTLHCPGTWSSLPWVTGVVGAHFLGKGPGFFKLYSTWKNTEKKNVGLRRKVYRSFVKSAGAKRKKREFIVELWQPLNLAQMRFLPNSTCEECWFSQHVRDVGLYNLTRPY